MGNPFSSAPRARTWASVLVVFSGPGHETDLAARLTARGVLASAIDTKIGGYRHDVTRHAVASGLLAAVAAGHFDFVFIATPCSSYSVAHRPRLRSRRLPMGIAQVPAEWRRYIDKHNAIGDFTAQLIDAADAIGVSWAVENPADRGDRHSLAYWPRHADHAPLWRHHAVAAAITAAGGVLRTFAQCAFHSPFQKWTSIAHAAAASPEFAALADYACPHGREQHAERAHGLDAEGRSRSERAAAYPPAMNEFIANAIVRSVLRIADAAAGRRPSPAGGRISDGRQLGGEVAAACEAARHDPPRWASLRNRRAMTPDAIRGEAFPGDLYHPHVSSKPLLLQAARMRERRAAEAAQALSDGLPAERQRRIDSGPIHISQLYLDGVYEQDVTPWLRRAAQAGAAIRAGARAPRVPTVTIGQDRMQPWARGVVWDCHDPHHCTPVQRSTRHTVFPGARQLDRAALRRIAASLDWHDHDIVAQAGEGGVEPRSHCSLDTVLSFHHPSLVEAFDAAERVVAADIAEQWVDAPIAHLPFVPCRVLPRGVIMQERARMVPSPDGGEPAVESYLKPRVTMDSSDHGTDAVNAGVESHERSITLPRSQDQARGLAICDTAGGEHTRAASYVVDAESAYRFCQIQHADLWTQCFLWFTGEGSAGVCVDRRLGFGGAFAPNRFQRISTLVAAHVQSMQAAFDATQPPPAPARLWTAERRHRQEQGGLEGSDRQLSPRYIQVYIGMARRVEPVPSPHIAPSSPSSVSHRLPSPRHRLPSP